MRALKKVLPAAVVRALGFAEMGAEGAALQDAVRAVVRRTGIRVVGPNTSPKNSKLRAMSSQIGTSLKTGSAR